MMLHDREVDRHRAPFDGGHGQWAKHSSVARAINFKTLNTMSKKKLVKLPNGNWANPDHVTAIELQDRKYPLKSDLTVWCKMKGGYGTASIYYQSYSSIDEAKADADRLASLLNA